MNLGSNHYRGAEPLKGGISAGTSSVFIPEKSRGLAHVDLVVVMLLGGFSRRALHGKGGEVDQREDLCVGKGP